MRVNFAHLRERSTSGGYIDFAVFEADASDRTNHGRGELLADLTATARREGLKIDKSALAFMEHGQLTFYGASDLVEYLSNSGLPQWTHSLDV